MYLLLHVRCSGEEHQGLRMQQRSFNCWYDSSRQRFLLHSVKATAASSGGKVGTVCCAAKAACEYKAMDVYFMQTGACTPFPGLLHHLTVSRLRPSVVPLRNRHVHSPCSAAVLLSCSTHTSLARWSAAALTISALPDTCTLAVSAAANAVRVNVHNAKYQGTAAASFVNKAGSLDLRKYLVKGANRVTLTLLNNRYLRLAVALVYICRSAVSTVCQIHRIL